MHQTRLLMGMPITVEVVEAEVTADVLDLVFTYFEHIDEKFSPYKDASELSLINKGELALTQASAEMQTMFTLAEQTKRETHGYFDIEHNGRYDPSGIVKGWAIYHAAEMLRGLGFENYYVDAGGDIQAAGNNGEGRSWQVGIRNPFNMDEIVKVLAISDCAVATSGSSIRGQHIYDPRQGDRPLTDIVSLTVIGPDIYEADRFATAAFAMQRAGIMFIEQLDGFEGYMIDQHGEATLTSGLGRYLSHA